MTDTPRNRRRKHARPAEILTAALEEFTRNGFAATRLDAVAARAGVSKGTLYLYFSGKEDLFKEMVRQTILPLVATLDDTVAHADSTVPSATLLRQVLVHLAVTLGHSAAGRLPKLILAEAEAFPELAAFWAEEVIGRAVALLRRLLDRGISRGEFRPLTVEPVVLFSPFLLMTLWNTAIAPATGRHLDPDTYARQAVDLLLNGLIAQPEPQP
ncbi:TetR/AcrR family transcriptional regulator [Novispirillum itersonii]|uniref:TetR/AcrR family transcriptional regulator n=1 Tax=Novispirillum itersonii TaxID=189 RepID=UPI0003670DE0|nr:TetR/AcrR family transcriptional regulator [Novispirillum itersonii]